MIERKESSMARMRLEVLVGDKEQCAINQYMIEVVHALPDDVQRLFEYREWTVKNAEGRGRFRELGCTKIPTLVIDGERLYESSIPSPDELGEAILSRV